MYGEKAIALIKELERSQNVLPPYNTDQVQEVKSEIAQLLHDIREDKLTEDTQTSRDNLARKGPSLRVRHTAVQRNVRCLLAYHYNRVRSLRTMRWEFGSLLPAEIKANLSGAEVTWFSKYSSALARYMRSIGDEGVNLGVGLKPPKALYIEVRCLVDYGRFELSDGAVLLLKKDSHHYLPRTECEELVRQGVLQHIVR